MSSIKYDYLIVGAGLFGATIANKLNEIGKKVIVVDKRSDVSGNVKTDNLKGINVHRYGAHIFHTSNEDVWRYVNKFAKFNNFINSPIANYQGEIYNLPFNMNTFSQMWHTSNVVQVKKIIAEQAESIKGTPKNLEEKAISLVGTDIYLKLIKEYTEKQWNKDTTELSPSIINRIPVRFTFNNNYFDDIHQGIPVEGYTQLVKNMLKGIKVKTNFNYLDDDNRNKIDAKSIIYTGPIDEFYNYKFGPLEYRSLSFDTKLYNMNNFQGNAVVNYTSHQEDWTRIIEHKFFDTCNMTDDKDYTYVTYETPADWHKGDEPYYPVNNKINNALYEKYANIDDNIIFGGRLGTYKYVNMDQTIENALELFNKLI